ncbi:MAG TPA: BamA/TamA family outer membrane protein [Anaeromyxobacteraceae bacterium]|nr:BamA/TamA family outer membrane protein [Anaeromyxobacteraceae bacterium]
MRPLLLALALAVPAAASSQPYDPSYRWWTLDTEHFQVHYHQGEEALAQRVARAAERAHLRLSPVIGFAPSARTQIVLSDDSDAANGMATPLYYDTIRLYGVPPSGRSELNDYRDWVQSLVDHEYVHILHLASARGIPAAFNAVFGRLDFPNGLLPPWMIEGLAVLHEADGQPGAGRNASALFDMYARAIVTQGAGLPSLNEVTHPSLDWPTGDVPYLLGGKMMEMLQRRYGDAAIAAFIYEQSFQIWPWAPGIMARRAFGEDLARLWDDLRADLAARYGRQLDEVHGRPVTQATPLTRRGAHAENPRWAPDGAFVAWLDRSLDERAGLRRARPDGTDLGLALPVDATGAFALRSPTEAVVSIGEVWNEFRYYEDLWSVDLATGRRRRLTDGERATDPDVRPGGDAIVYVARTGGGEMELRRRPILARGQGPLGVGPYETLVARPGAQIYSPRLSPDGARIAFELHEDGRRDLALYADGKVTRLTDDDAHDLDPSWSPDGRFLFFASDRGGIFNLYVRGEDGAVRQVTNVETGALEPEPSPDGRTLAFVGYSRAGYDLASVPLDSSAWIDPTPASPAPTPAAPAEESPPIAPRPYSPLSTVYPHWWLPLVGSDAVGTTWGLITGGTDVLGRHAWTLQGWYGGESRELGYFASYQGGWSWPALDAWSARDAVVSPGLPWRFEEEWTPLAPGATFTFTKVASAFSARLGWIGTFYRSLEHAPASTLVPSYLSFRDGFLSAATLELAWTDARRYVRSVSSEEGTFARAELQVSDPALGSDYSTARARGVLGGFLRVPGTRHVALAGRLAGGVARGSIGGRAPYRLGGLSLDEAGAATTAAFGIGGADELRGYEVGSLRGNGFVLGNAEVRFPLFRPDLGRTTWPVFLRRLHGAVFLDAGDAFQVGGSPPTGSHPLALETLQFGAGGELRLELFLGYSLPVELRLGVARGLGPLLARWEGGQPPSDPRATTQFFLTLGPAF